MVSDPVLSLHKTQFYKHSVLHSGSTSIKFNIKNDYKNKYQISIYDKLKQEDLDNRLKRKQNQSLKTVKESSLNSLVSINDDSEILDFIVDKDVVIKDSDSSKTKKHIPQINKSVIRNFINSFALSKISTKIEIDSDYQKRIRKKIFMNKIIMEKIISHFDSRQNEDRMFLLNSLLTLSKKTHVLVEKQLYSNVAFESTYRLAQFLAILKKSQSDYSKGIASYSLSDYVVSIDLSQLTSGYNLFKTYCKNKEFLTDNLSVDKISFATWRDWRLRDSLTYGNKMRGFPNGVLKRANSNSFIVSSSFQNQEKTKKQKRRKKAYLKVIKKKFSLKKNSVYNTDVFVKKNPKIEDSVLFVSKINKQLELNHPFSNLHLLKFKNNRDIPIGYLIHLLKICKNLKTLNMDRLSISEDTLLFEKKLCFKTFKLDDIINFFVEEKDVIFLSETNINKFAINSDLNYKMLTFGNFFPIFVELLQKLDIKLEKLSLKHCYFVTKIKVQDLLLHNCINKFIDTKKQTYLEVDFYKATMSKNYEWCNTSAKSWQDISVLMLICNLCAMSKNGENMLITFFQQDHTENAFFYESQILDINGLDVKASKVGFKLCFIVVENKDLEKYDVKFYRLNTKVIVQTNIFFSFEKFCNVNHFTGERDFFTFHKNMSYLRLEQNIRNGNHDFRYYDVLLLAEFLLIKLNKEFYERKKNSIGYNSFELASI
ncbi:hypothetical protein QEN19_001502 [Hanseniaspora menglaensis]